MKFDREFPIDHFPPSFPALMGEVEAAERSDRIVACLAMAATLIETAAYDIATTDHAGQVTHLILIAAELERRAEKLAGT